jgi:hypothetical protein
MITGVSVYCDILSYAWHDYYNPAANGFTLFRKGTYLPVEVTFKDS